MLLVGVMAAVILACYSRYKSERKEPRKMIPNRGYMPGQDSPPSYKSAPPVPSMYSHRPPSHTKRSMEPSRERPKSNQRVSYNMSHLMFFQI